MYKLFGTKWLSYYGIISNYKIYTYTFVQGHSRKKSEYHKVRYTRISSKKESRESVSALNLYICSMLWQNIEISARSRGPWKRYIANLAAAYFVSNYLYNSMGRGRSENWAPQSFHHDLPGVHTHKYCCLSVLPRRT